MGALSGNLGEGSFAGGHEVYERKALGMGISPMGARLSTSFGRPGEGLSTRDFEIWVQGALGVECPSLWELCEGNLEGGGPLLGTLRS
jgi:hypothetical protein